jgi:starvation-inducible outer membrane lipoprotein
MSTGGGVNQADNTTYPASQVMRYLLWEIAQQIIKMIIIKKWDEAIFNQIFLMLPSKNTKYF